MSAHDPRGLRGYEALTDATLTSLVEATRNDLGFEPVGRDVPAGTLFADALRCNAMAWAVTTTYPRGLVNRVARLVDAMANLLEAAGRG